MQSVKAVLRGARDRFLRLLGTPAGERYVESVERAVIAIESATERRRRLVAEISMARRRRETEGAALDRVIAARHRERDAAREALKAAERRTSEARQAAAWVAASVRQEIDQAQAGLLATCDPRIRATLAALEEAWRQFLRSDWIGDEVVTPRSGIRKALHARVAKGISRDDVLVRFEEAKRQTRALAFVVVTPVDLPARLAAAVEHLPSSVLSIEELA